MKIDNFSLAFNCPGCPAWGTSIVEQDANLVHLIKTDIATNIIIGVVHKMIPLYTNEFSLPIGKGSRVYNGKDGFDDATSEPILLAKFDKCFVNGLNVKYPFLLAIIKDRAAAHKGRLQIKFIPKIQYGSITNAVFFEEAQKVLKIDPSTPWTIYDIDVHNQEELHFKAVYADTFEELSEKLKNVEINVTTNESTDILNSTCSNILPLQQIFYGAPGTGKSNTIKREVEDQDRIHFRTTFHPDSDYSTFVGCYKPTLKSVKKTVVIGQDEKEVKPLTGGTDSVEQISYQFVPQAFTKAYCEAWNHYIENEESEPVYLIIEEINRGNCAQIFGDIFQLLDRKNGFSEYPIDADEDLKKFLLNGTKDDGTPWLVNKKGIENGQLRLPANLHIWATMNTSDQSLFPIDSAFKRRWDWKYIPIDYNKETWSIVAKGASYSWSDFLKKMNNLVASTTDSEDKMLGFYFAKAKDGIIDADTFVGKVVFYLWNDVFKDYGLPKEILNGAESKEFAFRNFFNVDGSANEDVVKRLLDNLEIKIAGSNENETYIENDDIDAGKAEHKETLVAVTINGERLTADDITQFDLYLNAIKKIGVDKVGPALEAMKYRRKGSPMATKNKVQSLLKSDGYSYVEADGYYFVKGAQGYTLVRILEDLNKDLNLNIMIEFR